MKISIKHHTDYHYETPAFLALQRLQIQPQSSSQQRVGKWDIKLTGASRQLEYVNSFGTRNQLIKVDAGAVDVSIVVEGEVETFDQAGLTDKTHDAIPSWLYRQATTATTIGKGLSPLLTQFKDSHNQLEFLHELVNILRSEVVYTIGATNVTTTAEEAWALKKGVCQDHAHLMIGLARALGMPARYVSGYLFMDGVIDQQATHAWCEIWVEGLGWVGFDVSNGISPDEHYVKIAVGRDYEDAAPITGIRLGAGKESLDVHLQIQQ